MVLTNIVVVKKQRSLIRVILLFRAVVAKKQQVYQLLSRQLSRKEKLLEIE